MDCLKGFFGSMRRRAKAFSLRSGSTDSQQTANLEEQPLQPLLNRSSLQSDKENLTPNMEETVCDVPTNDPTHDSNSSSSSLNSTANTRSSVSSSESSNTEMSEDPNQEWDQIKAIPDRSFVNLVLHQFDPGAELGGCGAFVSKRCDGAFHHVVMVTFMGGGTWVVKVPATGWAGRWTAGDACNLRSEAYTMEYIRKHTSIPVPIVMAYDETLNNEIRAPYILMEYLEGTSALDIWHDRNDNDDLVQAAPKPDRIKKRNTLLKSLAQTISELRNLAFHKIGMLDFPTLGSYHPNVVPIWRTWRSSRENQVTCDEWPIYTSSKAYWSAQLQKNWPKGEDTRCDGISTITEIMLDTFPFSRSIATKKDRQESFVLAHHDLDLQNLICDEAGHITGIIDWDGACIVPRCVGYTAYPVFLREDWESDYKYPESWPGPKELAHWRKVYANAMVTAMGRQGDCKYTAKSDIYMAVHWALYGNGTCSLPNVVDKIVAELLGPRFVDQEWFEERIGEGDFEEGEEVVQDELVGYLAPAI